MKNNFKLSDNGVKFLKQREGEILHVYKDSRGLLTVGVGHLLTAPELKVCKLNQKISQAESTRLLRADLEPREKLINEVVKVPLNQNQFDALLSLLFNIGNKGFKNSSVVKNLNAGNYKAAANAFLNWTRAGNDPNILRSRRLLEIALFNSKIKNSLSTAKAEQSNSGVGADKPNGAQIRPVTDAAHNNAVSLAPDSNPAEQTAEKEWTEGTRPPTESVPIAVQQAEPAKTETDTFITKFKAWYLAIPAGITAYLSAAAAWAKDAPVNLIIVLLAIAGLIVVVYVAGNLLIRNRRENRENALKLQREKQAHEITVVMLNSAASRDLNTVRLVPNDVQNSDS